MADNWWADYPGFDPEPLPSSPLKTSTGGSLPPFTLPTGQPSAKLSGSSLKGLPWDKIIPAGATLAASAFAGDSGSLTPTITEAQRGARAIGQQGNQVFSQGASDLAPVAQYFKSLLSGNPADVLAATMPQRGRIIDQYDAARRSSAQFTPRGGGQASTQQEIRAKEGSDLANVTSQARSDAATSLGTLGMSQEQLGMSAEEQAQQALAASLGPLFEQQQSDKASTVQTWMGIASLAAAFL